LQLTFVVCGSRASAPPCIQPLIEYDVWKGVAGGYDLHMHEMDESWCGMSRD
jgi:hypothetical protein